MRILLIVSLLFLGGMAQAETFPKPLIACKAPYACNTIAALKNFAIDRTEIEFSCLPNAMINCDLQPGDVVTRIIKLPVTGECFWRKFRWTGRVNFFDPDPDPNSLEIFWSPSEITWQCSEPFGHTVIPRNCNNSGGGIVP